MRIRKVKIFSFFVLCGSLIYCYWCIIEQDNNIDLIYKYINGKDQLYNLLINTSKCKIPYVEPFNSDSLNYFDKKSYLKCNNYDFLLTYVEKKHNNFATLHINNSLLPSFSWFPIKCCYKEITRNTLGNDPDNDLTVSNCVFFEKQVDVISNLIQVTCSTFFRTVYKNVHSIIFNKNIKTNNESSTKYSVLLIGIDSVSQQNLLRTMPKTVDHLNANENWIKLHGYNKVDDNTFPNIMAILTGSNYSSLEESYGPFETNSMDDIDFLWKSFKRHNYVTAYAEDWVYFSTFNYLKKGFLKEPTDLYFRPYLLASEALPSTRLYKMGYCSGPETSAERILNIAKDFVNTFRDQPKFGFFWMNTFSHNDINDPTMMDDVVRDFVAELETILEYTIVIFFSDHGFRFGSMRLTYSGWLEERLPFIYLMIPNSFQRQYPTEYTNLLDNSKQLTNNYDLYLTLQQILQLSNETYQIKPSDACPNCQSLFTQISNRNCQEISIEKHWCTCTKYKKINNEDNLAQEGAAFLIKELRTIVESFGRASRNCVKYRLRKVSSASIDGWKSISSTELSTNLLLVIQTDPDSAFEATLSVKFNVKTSSKQFELSGSISRLDRYAGKIFCVKGSSVEKYCYCSTITSKLRNYFCNDYYCLNV